MNGIVYFSFQKAAVFFEYFINSDHNVQQKAGSTDRVHKYDRSEIVFFLDFSLFTTLVITSEVCVNVYDNVFIVFF